MQVLGYDENSNTLALQFNTGIVWKYQLVTKEMYEELEADGFSEDGVRNLIRKSCIVGLNNGS